MSTALQSELVSVDDYLAHELAGEIKHEYVGGSVYAMAGANNRHNTIATNALAAFHGKLRGSPCRPFNSDTKVRVQMSSHVRFYYPDASVVCEQNSEDDSFQDKPVVIVEVVSPSTRRVDFEEKREAYLTIGSLDTYLVVEQDSPQVTVFQRNGSEFTRTVVSGRDASIPLPAIEVELQLAELYEGVQIASP